MNVSIDRIIGQTGLYSLSSCDFASRYYIVSNESTCRLMASPEVVGYDSYRAMLAPTLQGLKFLKDKCGLESLDILTILRGGLNYPLEECCSTLGIRVDNIDFLSCERIIKNKVITGLDIKYEKLHVKDGVTLAIGDIIASGDTLRLCLKHVIDSFRERNARIRKIIFFTIGGTKALSLMEDITKETRKFWPDFEGFECVFYEGVFTVYDDKGVTGVNVPDIDFGWKGGLVSPDFRRWVLDYDYAPALLEKCIIYDGGARRYEIADHCREVLEYWQDLQAASSHTVMADFVEEKIGYGLGTDFSKWLEICHLPYEESYRQLYDKEQAYATGLCKRSLEEICRARIAQFTSTMNFYFEK